MFDLGITNAYIVSKNYEYLPFTGSVLIRDSFIAEVRNHDAGDPAAGINECRELTDGSGKILMPGLVNCHCHSDMTLARGFGDDMTLPEQIKAFHSHNWFYKYISDDERYYARLLSYCEALLAGVTFICENMYWGLGKKSIKAMQEIGIKGALVEDVRLNFDDSDSLVSDDVLNDFTSDCRKTGFVPVIGLPAEEDYETGRLQRITGKLNGIDAFQTLHLAENEWRVELIREKYGMTPIEYLAHNGLLHNRLIGSHVVYANDNEIMMLGDAGVKIANTPLCEMKIADGIAPVPAMVRQGLTVGLGTDGPLWNNSNDIFREMKGMSLLHTVNSGIRSLSKTDILDMATAGGAAVFGKENEFGMIKEGMKADIILVETEKPHLQPIVPGSRGNIVSAIIYNVTGSDVSDVFINGRHLVKGGRLSSANVTEISAKVRQTAVKISKNLRISSDKVCE